jgi:septal ring factor EnvC (AmiA/AmiB activator)
LFQRCTVRDCGIELDSPTYSRTSRSRNTACFVLSRVLCSLLDTDTNDRQLDPVSTTTPTITRSKQIEELKSTIATQDQTLSSLQIQFSSLRTSHESYIDSLTDSHSAEVASLRNHVRVLEEQLVRRPLHHSTYHNFLTISPAASPHNNAAVANWLVQRATRLRCTPVTINTNTD